MVHEEDKKTYFLRLEIDSENDAKLEFKKHLEFKEITILKCEMKAVKEDIVKMHIRHRHNLAKLEQEQNRLRLEALCQVLKE